jgi:predicted PurR-regulated permease PerM
MRGQLPASDHGAGRKSAPALSGQLVRSSGAGIRLDAGGEVHDGGPIHEAQATNDDERSRALRHIRVAVLMVAIIAAVLALQSAHGLLIPVVLGALASYVLEPPVAWLVRAGLPRTAAAVVVCLAVAGMLAATTDQLWNQVTIAAVKLPTGAQQLRDAVQRHTSSGPNPVTQVQKAAEQLKELATPNDDQAADTTASITKVRIQPAAFSLSDYFWSTSGAAFRLAADTVVIVLLALYLLIAGDLFRKQLVEIAGPTLTRRKITLQLLDEISRQISRYLFLRATISLLVAVGTAGALWTIGMGQAGVWGLIAGAANIIPYAGSAAIAACIGIAAFVQFHTLAQTLLAVGLTVLVAVIEAYVITPLLTSRATEMNTVAVFLGLVFWGWLWGVAGLFIAVPMMMVGKVVCDHVDALHPIAVLLRARVVHARSVPATSTRAMPR